MKEFMENTQDGMTMEINGLSMTQIILMLRDILVIIGMKIVKDGFILTIIMERNLLNVIVVKKKKMIKLLKKLYKYYNLK
jgi:hypothetical protein